MELLKTIVELRYKDPASQFTFIDGIIQAVGGMPPTNPKTVLGGSLQIRLKGRKAFVLVEPQRFGLNFEEEVSQDELIKLTNEVNSYMHWNDVSRMAVRTFWIKEVQSFDELTRKSKEVFFKQNSLLEVAIDIAFPLTFQHGESKVNYNYGPMKKEEAIRQWLNFPDQEDLPAYFAFVDVDYFSFPDRIFSRKHFSEFLDTALEFGKEKAELTYSLLNI